MERSGGSQIKPYRFNLLGRDFKRSKALHFTRIGKPIGIGILPNSKASKARI